MDASLESILDSLPPKPSRSKLEPYQEFIRELRRRDRSYQEIVRILHERCGVTAAVHTVYNFVRVREKAGGKIRARQQTAGKSAEVATPSGPTERTRPLSRTPPAGDAWRNIERLKQRQRDRPAEERVFVFDENEPLKLVRGTGQPPGVNSKKT